MICFCLDFPAHVSGSMPDLVLCSEDNIVMSTESAGTLGSSDHDLIIVNTQINYFKTNDKTQVRNWRKANIEEMKNDLSNVDWESVFLEKDAQHCWDFFHETVDKIVEEHVPLRAVKNSSKPIWMNTNILRIVRKKRKLWKKYVKTRDYEQFVAYKKIEKDVKNCIRKAKKNIESKLAKDMKKNPKAFYSYINSKKSSRDTIGPLKIDERLIENDCDIAEHLNSFFSSVFTHDDPNCNFNVPRIKENIVNLENFDV